MALNETSEDLQRYSSSSWGEHEYLKYIFVTIHLIVVEIFFTQLQEETTSTPQMFLKCVWQMFDWQTKLMIIRVFIKMLEFELLWNWESTSELWSKIY